MELTGLQNPIVKAAAQLKQKKYRREQGLFLAEGLRTVEEAVAADAVDSIFYKVDADERIGTVVAEAEAQGAKSYCVSERVLTKIADTETPQGVIALCKIKENSFDELLLQKKLLLVLDRISDPGNLGTILRTADAAGAVGVVLLAGCADVYAPKTVRATMGSVFHIPIVSGIEEESFVSSAHKAGYQVLVTCLDGLENLYDADLSGSLALVMGNEIKGVSEGLLAAADKRIYIPMAGRAESLNVSVASGIVLFEALRRKLA